MTIREHRRALLDGTAITRSALVRGTWYSVRVTRVGPDGFVVRGSGGGAARKTMLVGTLNEVLDWMDTNDAVKGPR